MVEIVWKEPPPAVSSKYAAVLGELRKNPGRWALVVPAATSSGAYTAWKKLGCETRTARVNPGESKPRYEIYARWPEPREGSNGPKPAVVRPAGAGAYDPGLGRAARGVPADGLPVESLLR